MKLDLPPSFDPSDPAAGRHGDGKLARLTPFGLMMVLAFAFVPESGGDVRQGPLLAAGAVMIVISAVTLLTRWETFDPRIRFIPALGCLVVVGLLRDAAGTANAAVGVLPLVPVLWAALYASRRALLVSVAGVGAMFIVPMLIVGPPRYQSADWARAALWTLGALLIGLAVQRLVAVVGRQRAELEQLARTDSLTGLPNHRAWQEGLERELARAGRTGEPLAFAMIDLDFLKRVNDTYGHEAGSAAIRDSGRAWHTTTRGGDILARFGGDEFGLILVGATEEKALIAAERIRAATPGSLTCSVGVAAWDGVESGSDLFIRADRALYRAKDSGRDRVVAAGVAEAVLTA